LSQLITFQLGDQVLGADIMAIREIRTWSRMTPLPNSPSYVCGVANLRGVVLPVIDLRSRLGWAETEPTDRHVVIVMQSRGQLKGLLVDSVNDIATVRPEDVQPVPEVSATASEFLQSITTIEGRMVMVLELDKVLNPDEEFAKAA
jgi:purine-binding chemotaxis protein CheW